MSTLNRILLFFIFPIVGILSFEPATLSGAGATLAVVILFLAILGLLLWRGYSRALTFAIFLNGINVIVRLLMLLSTSFSTSGEFRPTYTLFSLIGMALSFFLLLRLDKVDVHQYMTRR